MERYWRELLDVLLPVDCAGCGRPGGGLCDTCHRALRSRSARRVWPGPSPPDLPPVFAAVDYADEARAVLLAHKERGALRLARPLGAVLADVVAVAARGVPGALSLVPVPSARRAVAARGQDATRRLARAAARELRRAGRPARVDVILRQRRPVLDQAGLNAQQRRENLMGAMEVIRDAGGWPGAGAIVLVDDLMTTGSSLAEAARAVRAAGGEVIGAAVVATPPGRLQTRPRRRSASSQIVRAEPGS